MKTRRVERGRFQPVRSTGLVAGQQLRGRVISRLGEGLFRIGAAGQWFDAESDLPLEPGQKLTARVELGDSKVFLRLQEDRYGESVAKANRDPLEIRRVLAGLGLQPTTDEIEEIQGRLDRYQPYGKMAGIEPSDIWILAILWARGEAKGADAFALLSYFLRQATLGALNQYCLPMPAVLLDLLEPGGDGGGFYVKREATEEIGGTADYPAARRREACELLNRKGDQHGQLLHALSDSDLSCALILRGDDQLMMRWVDNPAQPASVVEAVRAHGRVKLRIHGPETVMAEGSNLLDEWEKSLVGSLLESELEVESFGCYSAREPEILRFLFWRAWSAESFRDLRT